MIYPFRKTVYNCKQATLLSIKKAEGKISVPERIRLFYHLLYCDPCRRFIDQWRRLDRFSKDGRFNITPPMSLPEETKNRLQKIIDTL